MIFKAAESKSSKGMRYEAEFILECLMLHVKSPAAYRHLRSTKLLPLPDPSHLRRLMRGMSCKFGYNDFAVGAIEKEMLNKTFNEAMGTYLHNKLLASL